MNQTEIDSEEDKDNSEVKERKCVECGEMSYQIDIELSKPYMCSSCRKLWI